MSTPTILPPSRLPGTEPFARLTHHGLFSAGWLERPAWTDTAEVEALSRQLAQSDTAPGSLTAVLSYLLAVKGHCMEAAQTEDPLQVRAHYNEALRTCRTALNLLHHASEGTPGALADWALGVHSLILAQLAMPDLDEAERLCRDALIILSGIADPLCAGAEADAHAATRLAQEPALLAARMENLPTRALDKLDYYKYRIDYQESILNQKLTGLKDAHTQSLLYAVGWGLLNLALMAALPLNGVWWPRAPWSLPFALGVLLLWWATFDRPFRDGLRFFPWLRANRERSLAAFREAADLFEAAATYDQAISQMMREARTDRDLLAAYCLGTPSERWDTLDDTATIGREGKAILEGVWMIELDDRSPWPLAEALKVEPSMLPHGYRIWHGATPR